MTDVLAWGIGVVLWLQRFSPELDMPFQFLTFLGDQKFFLPLIIGLYWCWDRRIGAQLGLLLLMSSALNALVKDLAQQPRPFHYDARVIAIDSGSGGGFPSGHTQAAVVFWGYVAAHVQRPWVWWCVGGLLLGIPLSRVYLGVHFPTDLLGGYLLGAGMLLLFLGVSPWLEAWLARQPCRLHWVLAAGIPPAFLLAAGSAYRGTLTVALLWGIACGIVAERQWIGFITDGAVWQRVARVAVGSISTTILFGLCTALFIITAAPPVLKVGCFGGIGFWISAGVPWVCVRLGLASAEQRAVRAG